MEILRRYAVPLGGVAALLLIYLANPWLTPDGGLRSVVTLTFWVVSVLLILSLLAGRDAAAGTDVEIKGPAVAHFLFNNTRAGLVWLPIRLFVGFAWIDGGLHKLTDPGWTSGGAALRTYWERAVAMPEGGRPPITYEWYRDFVNGLLSGGHETWFAWLITLGELAVGIGLVLGILTGVAAFFGALMNMSFLLAGSASTNPVLFTLAIGLILAWKVAGYYGVDRYLLPRLGTPWGRGRTVPPRPVPVATGVG